MRSQNTFKSRPVPVLHTDAAEKNVLSVGEAADLVRFIDEAPEYGKLCHTKKKGEAVEFFKRHVQWFESKTDCRVRKIVINAGKKQAEGTNELELDGIFILRNRRL